MLGSTALAAQSFKVVGYFPTYRFSWLTDIEFDRVTHVNIAFANPDSTGALSCSGANIEPAVSTAHQHGCQVFVSLAGGYLTTAQENTWNYLAQPANRPGFIAKIVQYVQAHNLDGVDVDLEWQYVQSWYSPFIVELKTALAAHGYPLSAALPGNYRYPTITNTALASFDWVNMMIYDLTGPWDPSNPGQHSPYSWAVSCVQYWKNQNVPAQKLTLGVPFYGYDFGATPVSSFTYRGIVNQNPANAYLDQTAMKYWNGIPTIQAKTHLALNEVGGIMIWELGEDAFGGNKQYSLLKAIDDVIKSGAVTVKQPAPTQLAVYPNPASDYVLAELPAAVTGWLELTDSRGQLLIRKSLDEAQELNLSISDMPAGMYFLAISSETAHYFARIVKAAP